MSTITNNLLGLAQNIKECRLIQKNGVDGLLSNGGQSLESAAYKQSELRSRAAAIRIGFTEALRYLANSSNPSIYKDLKFISQEIADPIKLCFAIIDSLFRLESESTKSIFHNKFMENVEEQFVNLCSKLEADVIDTLRMDGRNIFNRSTISIYPHSEVPLFKLSDDAFEATDAQWATLSKRLHAAAVPV